MVSFYSCSLQDICTWDLFSAWSFLWGVCSDGLCGSDWAFWYVVSALSRSQIHRKGIAVSPLWRLLAYCLTLSFFDSTHSHVNCQILRLGVHTIISVHCSWQSTSKVDEFIDNLQFLWIYCDDCLYKGFQLIHVVLFVLVLKFLLP